MKRIRSGQDHKVITRTWARMRTRMRMKSGYPKLKDEDKDKDEHK